MAEKEELKHKITFKVGFIGGGNMAKAIFDGFLNNELMKPNQIYISGPHLENLSYFKDKGANITTNNESLIDTCSFIFLSIKPQMLQKVAKQLREKIKPKWENVVFISILAGTTIEMIENAFAWEINVVRVMPNTPLAVGEGCSVFACNDNAAAVEASWTIKRLFESSGLCLEVPESQINAIGALAGSGPAFMYLILEALADGGVKMGIPRSTAITLAAQTMIGAAKMVQMSGKHSAQLKDEVCSAGGTTITGMHALEKGGVRGAIIDAIEAATNKSIQMTQVSKKPETKKT